MSQYVKTQWEDEYGNVHYLLDRVRWHHRVFDALAWALEVGCEITTHWWGECAIARSQTLMRLLDFLLDHGTCTTHEPMSASYGGSGDTFITSFEEGEGSD